MEKVTIEKAKRDIVEIFGAVSPEEFRKRKEHLSWYSENEDGVTFFIDKNVTERGEVFEKLQEYFKETRWSRCSASRAAAATADTTTSYR